MFKFRFLGIGVSVLVLVFTNWPGVVSARQTVVNGSLGGGYDYWERDYDDDTGLVEDAGDRRDYFLRPEIELQSLGIHDSLSLRYSPVLRYDDLDDSTDVDHYLTLDGQSSLTRNWTVSLLESYVLSEDPERFGTPFATEPGVAGEGDAGAGAPAEAPPEITRNLGKTRYWTNDLTVETNYTYAEESDVGLGYTYRVLRNDSNDEDTVTNYDEYDRHEFFGTGSYMFNQAWNSDIELRFVQGIYDETAESDSRDLKEYWSDIGVNHVRDPKNTYSLNYRFNASEYEDQRTDIHVHELVVAWDHSFDERTSLVIGGGPSYVDSEDLDEDWGYNGQVDFLRTYQHGSIRALADKRFEPRNFSGSDDTGLTDITDIRVEGTYQVTSRLASSLFAFYRYEDILNPQGIYLIAALDGRDPATVENVGDVTYTRKSYSVGGDVRYTILSWLTASLRYSYYNQDGDLATDSFDEHQVMVMLSARKELWRR